MPKSNPSLLKVTNFEEVLCTHFLSKSSVPYNIGSTSFNSFPTIYDMHDLEEKLL
jgi:hypothetical protein